MKRRSFVIKSVLGGLVLGILPQKLSSNFFEDAEIHSIQTNLQQIRHGVFTQPKTRKVQIEKHLNYLEKNVFYKNGFCAGKKDLINVSFDYKGKTHSCSWIGSKVHFNSGEYLSELNRLIQINKEEPSSFAIQLKGSIGFETENGAIILPISGECLVNSKKVKDNSFIVEKARQIELKAESETKVLIIMANS